MGEVYQAQDLLWAARSKCFQRPANLFLFGNIVSGEFTPVLHKHTSRPDLADLLSVGVDKMQRNFEPLKHQIDSWKTGTLIDDQAKVIIYEACVEQRLPMRLLPPVHQNYFQTAYDAFAPRTLWSLSKCVYSFL